MDVTSARDFESSSNSLWGLGHVSQSSRRVGASRPTYFVAVRDAGGHVSCALWADEGG